MKSLIIDLLGAILIAILLAWPFTVYFWNM
jgi:hypothetical protein